MHQAQVSSDVRRCLENLDVEGFRKLWNHFYPHLPCPSMHLDCLAAMHMARTQGHCFSERTRFYSHRWLTDNGFPSQLPDRLKPKAERMYPRIVQAVGISVNASKNSIMKPLIPHIRSAMENAVMDCYANREDLNGEIVKIRMKEARENILQKLVGTINTAGIGKL